MAKESRWRWFGKHKILTVVGVIILIIIIAGSAASSKNSGVNTTPTNSPKGMSASSTKTKSSNLTAHVGATVDVGGSKGLAVTLQQVVDPATGADEFTTADAGKRFVAVKIAIQNNGTGSYNDDANSNVSLIGTDNQSYTADFDNVSECTNFNDGQYTLAAGESTTGCVVFQVPNGVNTAKIQFKAVEGFSNSTGEWLVP